MLVDSTFVKCLCGKWVAPWRALYTPWWNQHMAKFYLGESMRRAASSTSAVSSANSWVRCKYGQEERGVRIRFADWSVDWTRKPARRQGNRGNPTRYVQADWLKDHWSPTLPITENTVTIKTLQFCVLLFFLPCHVALHWFMMVMYLDQWRLTGDRRGSSTKVNNCQVLLSFVLLHHCQAISS